MVKYIIILNHDVLIIIDNIFFIIYTTRQEMRDTSTRIIFVDSLSSLFQEKKKKKERTEDTNFSDYKDCIN